MTPTPTPQQIIELAREAEIGDSHGYIIRQEAVYLRRFATLLLERFGQQAAVREALTGAVLEKVLQETAESIDSYHIVMTHWPLVARAVEAAHGIGGKA